MMEWAGRNRGDVVPAASRDARGPAGLPSVRSRATRCSTFDENTQPSLRQVTRPPELQSYPRIMESNLRTMYSRALNLHPASLTAHRRPDGLVWKMEATAWARRSMPG